MTEIQMAQVILLASAFLLFAVFAWMPVTRGARAFFGVRVEPTYFDGAGRLTLRRYRFTLAAAYLAIVAIAVSIRPLVADLVILVATELMLALAAFVVYARFASAVRPNASPGGMTRFASSMRTRGAGDRVWLDAIVAAFAALTFAAPLLSYNEMPLHIPIHWNATGAADRWGERSLLAILFIPALAAYLQIFLHVLRRDFGNAKMTLPADSTEEYLHAKEKYFQTNIDTLDWARATIAITLCSISLLQTFTAVERLHTMERLARAGVFLGIAALLGGIVFLLVRMIRINARLQQQTGNDYAQRPADEHHWKHGGLTYSNPDDPALVVEKLVGIGYTLNMAHPGIRSRMLLMAGIPMFVIWAIVAM